jgi:hypothetical protein
VTVTGFRPKTGLNWGVSAGIGEFSSLKSGFYWYFSEFSRQNSEKFNLLFLKGNEFSGFFAREIPQKFPKIPKNPIFDGLRSSGRRRIGAPGGDDPRRASASNWRRPAPAPHLRTGDQRHQDADNPARAGVDLQAMCAPHNAPPFSRAPEIKHSTHCFY